MDLVDPRVELGQVGSGHSFCKDGHVRLGPVFANIIYLRGGILANYGRSDQDIC